MWPYGGKKTFTLNNGNNLNLTGNNYYPVGKQAGAPNREYFNQLSMSVSVGLNGFPANSIAPDGRIVRQYGINKHDVTDEFYGKSCAGFAHLNLDQPGKQFHNRNVSQLKVVLNMPPRQRKESLSQITTAIVKNEVVPPFSQLQQDEILSDHLKKSAVNLQNAMSRLPPLTRTSSLKAKRFEQMASLNMSRGNERRLSVKLDESFDVDDDDGLPHLAMRLPRRKSSEHVDASNVKTQGSSTNWKAVLMRRRKSFNLRFGVKNNENKSESSSRKYQNEFSKRLERKDSVEKITESIRDQFRAALQDFTPQERQTESRDSGIADAGLSVTGCVGNEHTAKQIQKKGSRNVQTGYKLRHEYGKNLERNWFRNEYLKKQSKERSLNRSPVENGYDLRLDIFYSPEPQSDDFEDLGEDAANGFLEEDDASMKCGGFSTATAEYRSRRQRQSMQSLQKSNLDTHKEIDEDTGDTSESDIEIILKDNQLIQRKTKHKMLKKRKRQIERYRPFLLPEMDPVREFKENEDCPPLTDQEIRALRLNLKNKEKTKRLKGKRKFLQIANAVFAFVQFRNILRLVRRRKRNIMRKRQQRLAKIVAKKWSKKAQDNSDESDRESTPKPTLKEQFLQEVGHRLIFEVEKLKFQQKGSREEEDTDRLDNDSDKEEVDPQKNQMQVQYAKPNPDKTSKFAAELKKITTKDLENVAEFPKVRRKRQRRRRHSIPKLSRPFEFLVEIPVKTRQRKSRASVQKQNEIRRVYSPPAPKCSCHRGKHADATLRSQSLARDSKCPHQPEVKKRKVKTIKVQTAGLMRTYSLENLSKRRPIELKDLLADIDIPAKEIKLQILERKFRRQRKKKQQIRLSPCRLPERPVLQQDETDADSDISGGSDNSDESDYDFVYGGPFVGSGVMWNKSSKDAMRPTWTEEDVDREVKRITKIFNEMKECTYLRLNGFNDAIMEKLKQTSYK